MTTSRNPLNTHWYITKGRGRRKVKKVSWLPRLLRAIFRLVGVWGCASVPGSQTRVSQLSELMFISFTTSSYLNFQLRGLKQLLSQSAFLQVKLIFKNMLKQNGELRSKRDDERQSLIENTTRSLSSCFVGLPCLHNGSKNFVLKRLLSLLSFDLNLNVSEIEILEVYFWTVQSIKKIVIRLNGKSVLTVWHQTRVKTRDIFE